MDGYRPFKRDRQGGLCWGVVLYVRGCTVPAAGDDMVESIWVRRKKKSK